MKLKVSAIVPCYNEAARLPAVLSGLTKSKILDEVIVVDDGSTDATQQIMRRYRNISYIRNEKNIGKGFALDRGVRYSTGDVIFFCDADLQGITPAIVSGIVSPVLKGNADMFLGLRFTKLQKTALKLPTQLFSLTGTRALKRDLWLALPDFYKEGYRIEMGLNYMVQHRGGRILRKQFPFKHKIKEDKYGVLEGMHLRMRMFRDIVLAFMRFHAYDRWTRAEKLMKSVQIDQS